MKLSLATVANSEARVHKDHLSECDTTPAADFYNRGVRSNNVLRSRLRRVLAVLSVAVGVGLSPTPLHAQAPAWQPWAHLIGVVDVGSLSDDRLLAMAGGHFFTLSEDGHVAAYASGPDDFTAASADAESYFVVTPNQTVEGAGCAFAADEVLVLDLGASVGVTRISPQGEASRLAVLNGVDTLGGIAFDTTGAFRHRVLVTGTHAGLTTVFAVDCAGAVSVITTTAPLVEGGMAVAPSTFGAFAGALIAPDEKSGQIYAIDAVGQVTVLATPSLPTGGDTGVESLGFLPAGFSSKGASVYVADRGTPDNPFPGSDSILRLDAASLAGLPLADGDLLVATEGQGLTVAIHCEPGCTSASLSPGTPGGHIEGKMLIIANAQ
ncbi:MAG: hypothetical protein NVSMB2_15330 [Chloroflexota bacterium]